MLRVITIQAQSSLPVLEDDFLNQRVPIECDRGTASSVTSLVYQNMMFWSPAPSSRSLFCRRGLSNCTCAPQPPYVSMTIFPQSSQHLPEDSKYKCVRSLYKLKARCLFLRMITSRIFLSIFSSMNFCTPGYDRSVCTLNVLNGQFSPNVLPSSASEAWRPRTHTPHTRT